MKRQSQYHAYLRGLGADQACDFLLVDSSFIDWYCTSNSEMLVLLGEMGCGKTVAIAFLIDESTQQLPQSKLRILTQTISRPKVVLSSRPQEEIQSQVDEMATICLPCDAKLDGIVVEQSVEKRLPHLSEDVKTIVIERLSRLAQGSAIWTRMVVELIQVRRITALGPMRLFLEELPLPGQLSELYRTLFKRCTSDEPENKETARTALRILAVARRPLSILELAWAAALGTSRREIATVAALGSLVNYQRVTCLVYPFIARPDLRDLKKRQIRLVHQSVKDFIINEWTDLPCVQTPSNTTTIDQVLFDRRVERLESFMLDICLKYLALHEIGTTKLFSAELMAIKALPQDVDLFSEETRPKEYDPRCSWEDWEEDMIRYDPTQRGFGEFFTYASCHWVHHFGAVTAEPLPSLSSLEELCRAGSMRLDNWIQQNRRPDCAILPRCEFDSSLYDPLSITSLYGSAAMLRGMLEDSDLGGDRFLPGPMMGAASQILQWGDLSRLKILLESKHGHQLRNLDFFRLVIKRWSLSTAECKDWDPAFDLVDSVLETLVREQWGNELLCVAASAGCMPIVRRLVGRAQHNAELKNELTRCVLHEEPQQNALRIAVRLGDLDMCRLLVSTGMDPLSAMRRRGDGHLVLKDEPHENKNNWREILQVLCENVDLV